MTATATVIASVVILTRRRRSASEIASGGIRITVSPRGRTMAPRRPVLYPDQVGLALLTLVAVGFGLYVVVRALIG